MGILADVITVIDSFKDIKNLAVNKDKDDLKSMLRTSSPQSISKRAKEGIVQFPSLAESSIDIEYLMKVNKAIEKNNASFLQLVMNMNSVTNMDSNTGLNNYIRKFHTNMDADGFDLTSTIKGEAIKLIGESFNVEPLELDNFKLKYTLAEGTTNHILYENKVALKHIEDDFNLDILNRKYTPMTPGVTFESINKVEQLREAQLSKANLSSNEIKKANELVPTTLRLTVNVIGPDKQSLGTKDFIIGVKSVLHPIPTDEMIANLGNCEKSKFFNFVRWTSGEISFFKDLVLNLDGIKTDVANRANGANPLWLAFKSRAAKGKIFSKTPFGKKNAPLPIASVIISRESAEAIKAQYRVDLNDIDDAKKVMGTFSLLCLVIVDTFSESANFLYDGNGSYETIPFSALDRENNKGMDIKEVIKMVNKL